jgi:hypothetical protein
LLLHSSAFAPVHQTKGKGAEEKRKEFGNWAIFWGSIEVSHDLLPPVVTPNAKQLGQRIFGFILNSLCLCVTSTSDAEYLIFNTIFSPDNSVYKLQRGLFTLLQFFATKFAIFLH